MLFFGTTIELKRSGIEGKGVYITGMVFWSIIVRSDFIRKVNLEKYLNTDMNIIETFI